MALSDGEYSRCSGETVLRFILTYHITVHKYPFSLFNEAKRDGSGGQIDKVGNVTEALDKSIGRNVYRIKGAVSANNYIDFTNLHLEGKHLCLQLCLFKSTVATLHLELVTTKDVSLRVTISTLYDHPRFLGRSLRLPLPIKTEWSNLVIDIDEILSSNCPQTFGRLKCIKVTDFSHFLLKSIKRVQLCSNMAIRDFVTNNIPFESNSHVCSNFVQLLFS